METGDGYGLSIDGESGRKEKNSKSLTSFFYIDDVHRITIIYIYTYN